MIDVCARCGYPEREHSYNGACYGLCGKFERIIEMTDKEWHEAMAEIHNLRFQLLHNMAPVMERTALRIRIRTLLERLAQEYAEQEATP
jgi:hypothetical protein